MKRVDNDQENEENLDEKFGFSFEKMFERVKMKNENLSIVYRRLMNDRETTLKVFTRDGHLTEVHQ